MLTVQSLNGYGNDVGDNNENEIEIWKHGWNFNYLIGQLNYVSEKYNKKIKAYIENGYYFKDLQDQKGLKVELVNEEITKDLLDKLLEKGGVIVYLDVFFLSKIIHAPHFVVATRKIDGHIEIADPGDGKIKTLPVDTINGAINSLRTHLKYSPVLVVINE